MTESLPHILSIILISERFSVLGQFGAPSTQAILMNTASFSLEAGMAWE